jgi:hypothetical protein
MIELRVLELLCARFCHEMVSPVGAIGNGVELLDEDDPDFVREAIALIGQSARTASRRLQFYRFAYGTAPTAPNVTPQTLLMRSLPPRPCRGAAGSPYAPRPAPGSRSRPPERPCW